MENETRATTTKTTEMPSRIFKRLELEVPQEGGDLENSGVGGGGVRPAPSPTSSTSTKSSFDETEFGPAPDSVACDFTFNVIMLGDSGVGKTDLIGRLSDESFTTKFFATIGINMESYVMELDGKKCKLQIWDPSGSERFRDIITKYFHKAHGVMFVYDVTYQKSFENIKEWIRLISNYPEVDSKVAKVLVGNKCDTNRRVVSTAEGETLANMHQMKFVETSTRTGLNVRGAFVSLCQGMKSSQEDSRKLTPKNSFSSPKPSA